MGFLLEFCYSLGILPIALFGVTVRSYIAFLYTDRLGLPTSIAGISWAVFCVINAIAEPYCGYFADQSKSGKYGKHLPWLLYLVFPWVLVTYLIFTPPEFIIGKTQELAVYYTVLLVAFGVISAASVVNYNSAYTELFTEQSRGRVTGIKQSFAVLGTILGLALPPSIAKQDWTKRDELAKLLATLSVPIFLIFLIVCLPSVRPLQETKKEQKKSFFRSIADALSSKTIFFTCLMTSFVNLALSYLGSSSPLFNKYVLGVHKSETTLHGYQLSVDAQTTLLQTVPTLLALICIPIYLTLISRFGPRNVWFGSVFYACVCLLPAFYIGNDFQSGIQSLLFVGTALSGFFIMPDIFLGDAIQQTKDRIGTGIVFGCNALMMHLTSMLVDLGKAFILENTSFVQPSEAIPFPTQSPIALKGIRSLVSLVPCLFFVLSLVALYNRPIVKPKEKKQE